MVVLISIYKNKKIFFNFLISLSTIHLNNTVNAYINFMILKEIYYISLVFSLIAAAIGVYLSLKSWKRLRVIELDTLKARAFLDISLPPELHPVYYGIFLAVI